jgi:hypothetical protein
MSVGKDTKMITRVERTRLIVAFMRFYEAEKAKDENRIFLFKEFVAIASSLEINAVSTTYKAILKELEIPWVHKLPKTPVEKHETVMMNQKTRRRITALETRVQELEDQFKSFERFWLT